VKEPAFAGSPKAPTCSEWQRNLPIARSLRWRRISTCPPQSPILVSRGIATPAAAEALSQPKLEAFLSIQRQRPHAQLLGMHVAVERILSAILAAEPILIYGDYDVDGTTATVLLKTTIERIGLALDPQTAPAGHLPRPAPHPRGLRHADQPSSARSRQLRHPAGHQRRHRHPRYCRGRGSRALGLDLIVTDHHLPDDAVDSRLPRRHQPRPARLRVPQQAPVRGRCRLQTRPRAAARRRAADPDPSAVRGARNRILLSHPSSSSSPSPLSPTRSRSPARTGRSQRWDSPRLPTPSSPACAR
jgi:hypothetical protein